MDPRPGGARESGEAGLLRAAGGAADGAKTPYTGTSGPAGYRRGRS